MKKRLKRKPENPDLEEAGESEAAAAPLGALTLKVREFGNNDTDNAVTAYDGNRILAETHVQEHDGENTEISDVQFWRLWLEDETGEETDIQLPARTAAHVSVEYLAAEDGAYPKALHGEPEENCSNVLDLGSIFAGGMATETSGQVKELAGSAQAAEIPAEAAILDVSGEQQDAQRYCTGLFYSIEAAEDGTSAWGNLTAFYAVQTAQMQAEGNLTFTAYDQEDAEGADTKFTVTMPEGTSFKVAGAEITETTPLTLKIEQYTRANWEGFSNYKGLIDRHMNWHTGVMDSTNDVQIWRAWLEDGEGKDAEVVLPEGGRITVVVEYLCPNGHTSSALQGEIGTRRTCVMDMGELGIGTPNEDQFTETDEYALATSYEPGNLDKTDSYYKKITYYIDKNGGDSAWGNLIALCSMKLPKGILKL